MPTPPPPSSASRQAFFALAIAIGFTVAMYLLPQPWGRFVAWPLMLFSTYAHEMSHGIAALVVGE